MKGTLSNSPVPPSRYGPLSYSSSYIEGSPSVTKTVTIVSPEPLEIPYEARYAWPAATDLPVLGQSANVRQILVVTNDD